MTGAFPAGAAHERADGTGIPRISLWSRAGAESVLWSLVIAHLVKWAVSFGYFSTWQVRYQVGYGPATFTVAYWKDFWDRLPVHVQDGLPGEAGALCGIAYALLLGSVLAWRVRNGRSSRRRAAAWYALLVAGAAGTAFSVAGLLAGWHAHWLPGQDAPAWWVTARHEIRDVGIALVATIIVRLLFTKPKFPADDNPGLRAYLARVPLAIGAALIPIGAIAVLAWKLPWLMQHGWHVPGQYGPLAAEANGWIAAGTWITLVMGVAGGLVAGKVIQRVADDVQWFFAGRSSSRIRAGAPSLTGSAVAGTPSHRLRVHWLLDNSQDLPERSPWLTRGLLAIAAVSVLFAGAGAWLNLAGPAAH